MNGNLTADDVEYISELFVGCDFKNPDGGIGPAELRVLLGAYGWNVDDENAMAMFKNLDKDGSKSLSLDEFISLFGTASRTDIKAANIKRIFRSMDLDISGLVTPQEITDALKKEGINLRKGELDELMSKVDCNVDGKLTVEEFKRLWAELC